MARIPQTFIDDLLTRIDIIDIVDTRVPLKKTGSNYSARCPFHDEKTPSFTVSAAKQFYYCFGCAASGNAIGFLMQHDNLSFIEAIEHLAQQVGIPVPMETNNAAQNTRRQFYATLQRANDFYQQQLRQHPTAEQVKIYLKNRGLSGKIAKTFNIGFAPAGWDNLQKYLADIDPKELIACGLLVQNEKGKFYDRFRDRIIFPIHDRQGRVVAFGGRVLGDELPKYLNSPETDIFHKGSELYGLYEALHANRQLAEILVVEGYMDVIALAQHGITNAVATLGTATTKLNAERLFRQVSHVIFCFDGDTAGRAAAWRALENILPLLEDEFTVHFMFLPEGEDPDSLIRKLGKPAFQQLITDAMPLSRFLLNHLCKATDLNSLDGRSRLVKLAEPLLKQIPGKIFQQLLISELAKRARMDAEQLRVLLKLEIAVPSMPYQQRPQQLEKAPNLMSKVISLVLQRPETVSHLENGKDTQNIQLPGVATLKKLLDLLTTTPNLTAGALLEHWRDNKEYQRLKELARQDLGGIEDFSIEQATNELADALKRLEQASIEQKLFNLHEKRKAGEFTPADKHTEAALRTAQRVIQKK